MKNPFRVDRAALAGVIFTALSPCAWAQLSAEENAAVDMMKGTLYVIPHRDSVEGKVDACGLEFAAITRDFSTKHGAPVKVVGSIYLRSFGEQSIFVALKLGLYDGMTWTNPVAPNYAFARAPGGPAPARYKRTDSEDPGYALFIGTFDDSLVKTLASIADKSQVEIGFNRLPGQMDVTLPIDLTVKDTQVEGAVAKRTQDNSMVMAFLACSGELVKAIK